MARRKWLMLSLSLAAGLFVLSTTDAALRGGQPSDDGEASSESDWESEPTPESMAPEDIPAAPPERVTQPKKTKKKILSGSDGFIAGPDWEFDGFVAGGQGQEVRSMFVANDLLYLNVGEAQGISAGDRVGIYKRGARIKDPQTGQFIGYEVRQVAVAEITDRSDENSSARVIRANDGVEIGDLVRKDTSR